MSGEKRRLDNLYLVCLNSRMIQFSNEILRGHLELLVLATLARGGAHGFEVMRRLNEEGRGAFAMKEGTLYPVLYRLERQGLIRGDWEPEDAPRKGPRRKQYVLTDKGQKALATRRDDWRAFVSLVGTIVEV
jgi:DNA-binding PadR family transcriptional regulator